MMQQRLRQFRLAEVWRERPYSRGARKDECSVRYFQGRTDQLGMLKTFFLYGVGGTVLVRGNRRVEKSATVDKALIDAAG